MSLPNAGECAPLPALDVQPDDRQGEARLGGLRYARLCRTSASIWDKSDTVSFAKNAVSKELGENRFKQLIKKVGEERLERSENSRSVAKAYAMAMLEKSEQGFKENYALLKKLSEM